MLATATRHHGITVIYCHCSKQHSPIDLLFSGGDSLKEKGQLEKMGPEEGREEGRGSRSPWGQLSQH